MDTYTNTEVVIHLGIHKTASTYFQKYYFPLYEKEVGYIDLRKHGKEFLFYLLHCNELQWDPNKAISLFMESLKQQDENNKKRILLSDEQFCGSPWDNAASRKQTFDRLNRIFPEAKFFILFRNQEDIVASLYLQYIKTGGSATLKEFLIHKRHPLIFSLKAYLDYGTYLKYMISVVGSERIGCFLFEDFRNSASGFLNSLNQYLNIDDANGVKEIPQKKANKSLSLGSARFLLCLNKFFRSERQPFLLLSRRLHVHLVRFLVKLSSSKGNSRISSSILSEYCSEEKKNNHYLAEFLKRDIEMMGY